MAPHAESDRLAIAREGRALQFELSAIAKRLDRHQAVLFPRPGGHHIPVVSGFMSTRAWIAEAMGVSETEVLARFRQAAENPLRWQEVEAAPAQQVVQRQVDVLRQLPIHTHSEHDSGPYITAGLVIARNPKTGIQNVSINRIQVSGPDRLPVLILPRHLHAYF